MKLIYGKGICRLQYQQEPLQSVIIRYKGSIVIRHYHMEYIKKIDNFNALFSNFSKDSLLVHSNNKICIGFLSEEVQDEIDLFRWVGNLKITSVIVNGKSITTELTGVDYWNLVKSTWNSAGKPEEYKGTYQFGKSPRRKKRRKQIRGRSTGISLRRITSGGGY